MTQNLFAGLAFSLLLLGNACAGDAERVQEIRPAPGGGPTSDLVRIPISAEEGLDTNKIARLQFEQAEYDFGSVDEGIPVERRFKFVNTGKVPLIISDARSSCGCTVPEWPKEPVPPGGTGEIKATFDTNGRPGNQQKTITVLANTIPNETKVVLKGVVKAKKQ